MAHHAVQLRELVPPSKATMAAAQQAGGKDANANSEARRPKHVVLADTIALLKQLQIKVRGRRHAPHTAAFCGRARHSRSPASPRHNGAVLHRAACTPQQGASLTALLNGPVAAASGAGRPAANGHAPGSPPSSNGNGGAAGPSHAPPLAVVVKEEPGVGGGGGAGNQLSPSNSNSKGSVSRCARTPGLGASLADARPQPWHGGAVAGSVGRPTQQRVRGAGGAALAAVHSSAGRHGTLLPTVLVCASCRAATRTWR